MIRHLTICSQTPHSLSASTRCPGCIVSELPVIIGHLKALGCREHETLGVIFDMNRDDGVFSYFVIDKVSINSINT